MPLRPFGCCARWFPVTPGNVGGVCQEAGQRAEGGKTRLTGAEPHDTGWSRGTLAPMPRIINLKHSGSRKGRKGERVHSRGELGRAQ